MTETTAAGPAANKLRVDDLHLSYGDNAILKGVSMQLAQGEVVSLLGPSGSGKTTLLRAVAGLEAPHRGTIRIEDRPVFDASQQLEVPAERRNLGLVFQSYALWPHRTVADNVAYGLKLRNVPAAESKMRVETALTNLGLGHLGARLPHQLSGGQQQRVELPAEKRNLGLVFQSYALWPHRTVADNVAYGLKLRNVPAAESKTRVETALTNLGLGHLGARLPHQLSGGQQQRVAIARALVYNPPVILMDEPLSNLDAKLREEARAWLRELILKMRLSALVVTHDQNEAMAMSDRILLLNNGVIEQQGTPQELYGQPRTLFVADFMGSNNRVAGRIVERRGNSALLGGERARPVEARRPQPLVEAVPLAHASSCALRALRRVVAAVRRSRSSPPGSRAIALPAATAVPRTRAVAGRPGGTGIPSGRRGTSR